MTILAIILAVLVGLGGIVVALWVFNAIGLFGELLFGFAQSILWITWVACKGVLSMGGLDV